MQKGFVVFLNSIVPITCILAAAALAWRGTEGWGWFLFAAVLIVWG
ncbi:hypothetical protein [Shinella sp.]